MTTRGAHARAVYDAHVRSLPRDVQLQLVAVIADEAAGRDAPAAAEAPVRFVDLYGLGADVWVGVDADAYVNELRDEWDRPR